MSPFGCAAIAYVSLESSALLMIKVDYVPLFISMENKTSTIALECHGRHRRIPSFIACWPWDSGIHLGGAPEISWVLNCCLAITIIATHQEIAGSACTAMPISALLLINFISLSFIGLLLDLLKFFEGANNVVDHGDLTETNYSFQKSFQLNPSPKTNSET